MDRMPKKHMELFKVTEITLLSNVVKKTIQTNNRSAKIEDRDDILTGVHMEKDADY